MLARTVTIHKEIVDTGPKLIKQLTENRYTPTLRLMRPLSVLIGYDIREGISVR